MSTAASLPVNRDALEATLQELLHQNPDAVIQTLKDVNAAVMRIGDWLLMVAEGRHPDRQLELVGKFLRGELAHHAQGMDLHRPLGVEGLPQASELRGGGRRKNGTGVAKVNASLRYQQEVCDELVEMMLANPDKPVPQASVMARYTKLSGRQCQSVWRDAVKQSGAGKWSAPGRRPSK
jgi:hypothetical protein